MAVATQEVFLHTGAKVVLHDATAATPERTLVKLAGNDRFGVTLTDTKGVVKADKVLWGNVKVTGVTQPGFSNEAATSVSSTGYAVGVATDGTWEFEGVASVNDGTGTSSAATAQGAAVYYHSGTGKLTTASVANNLVGYVNYPGSYVKVAGTLPVRLIGA